jgi:hypothetical protein
MAFFSQAANSAMARGGQITAGRSPVQRSTALPAAPSPRAPVSTALPVRGTIARPVSGFRGGGSPTGVRSPIGVRAPIAFPVSSPPATATPGSPARGTAIVSPGNAGSVTLGPQGGSGILPSQPAGPPPAGTPPSISMVTSTGSSGAPAGAVLPAAAPAASGFDLSSIPMGWIALAGVLVLVVFLARE